LSHTLLLVVGIQLSYPVVFRFCSHVMRLTVKPERGLGGDQRRVPKISQHLVAPGIKRTIKGGERPSLLFLLLLRFVLLVTK